jgi:hypothetical protein
MIKIKRFTLILSVSIISLLLIAGGLYYFKLKSVPDSTKSLVEDFFGLEKTFEPLFEAKNFEETSRVLGEAGPHIMKSKSEIDKSIYEYYRVRHVTEAIILANKIPSPDLRMGYAEQLIRELFNNKTRLITGKNKFESKAHWVGKIDKLAEELKAYSEKSRRLKLELNKEAHK